MGSGREQGREPTRVGGSRRGWGTSVAMMTGVALVAVQSARAAEFTVGNGIEGRASLDLSVGASVRLLSPDSRLISKGNGGTGDGTFSNDGEKNYRRGDLTSALGKALGEFELKRDDLGLFLRGKAWYDAAQSDQSVPFGSNANGFRPNSRLNDDGFQSLSKFSGVSLLDAYGYATFDLDAARSVKVKVGNQVVNWGESRFIPGINQSNPIDASAFHKPGTEVKEVLLPVPQISANLGLGNGISLEGFYQFQWERTAIDGCGTFWSPSDLLACSARGAVFPSFGVSDPTAFSGVPQLRGLNQIMSNAGVHKGHDGGQFGISPRIFISSIDTDIGFYYTQYSARTPIYSLIKRPSARGSLYSLLPSQYFEDYSASGIKIYGASASTEIAGWSVAGEISRANDVPVQINPTDMTSGMVRGAGPMARLALLPMGSVVRGYDRKSRDQIQISAIRSLPNLAGADSVDLVGEAAYQHWDGIGSPATSTRYGRATVFGLAGSATSPCGTTTTIDCGTGGFARSDAWGYRLQVSFRYEDVVTGVNLTPRLFWAQDVKGISPDGTFVADRWNLGIGLHADLNKTYYADLSYSTYNHSARYDTFHDRDFVSIVTGVKF
ncbi:MAG: DUF1302 domain-containing protein [Telmatospirillum sp.]|nr:DUF1302 domain-containing protein [Telmatospirillum sp.]